MLSLSFHFLIRDILVPLLSLSYSGISSNPPRLSPQEQGFVYLLPMQLKLYWNMLQKELVEFRNSHGALLLQMVALLCWEACRFLPRDAHILSPATHFPWTENWPGVTSACWFHWAPDFLQAKTNTLPPALPFFFDRFCKVDCVPWKKSLLDLDSGLAIIQAHPMDVTSLRCSLTVTSCNSTWNANIFCPLAFCFCQAL